MKVILIPGAGAIVKVRTPDGHAEELTVDAIEITPFFRTGQAPGDVLRGEVEVDIPGQGREVVDRFALSVSAVKGTVTKMGGGSQSAVPLIELPKSKRDAATAAAAAGVVPEPVDDDSGDKE